MRSIVEESVKVFQVNRLTLPQKVTGSFCPVARNYGSTEFVNISIILEVYTNESNEEHLHIIVLKPNPSGVTPGAERGVVDLSSIRVLLPTWCEISPCDLSTVGSPFLIVPR
ncbi:hypothetical protein J6590_018419 [Homalodisca vitripennis]|nr:hypothetical protein J6590_018419 [Homalodisca vitripennis]